MELTSLCGDDTMRLLEQNGLAFPFSMYPGRAGGGHRAWAVFPSAWVALGPSSTSTPWGALCILVV